MSIVAGSDLEGRKLLLATSPLSIVRVYYVLFAT